MNTPVKLYHELRKVSPEKARMLVRKILEENNGKISSQSIPRVCKNSSETSKTKRFVSSTAGSLTKSLSHSYYRLHT
ncbi:MAG TPA: hypothetical protein ENG66_09645 [Thermococcus sp.]|nr:hypothetical protein [Thermococcus sp.]